MMSRDLKLNDVVPARAVAHLRDFRGAVEMALPGRVADVVLYGSRARGDARRDSDYDIAVFVRDLTDRRPVRHALADAALPFIIRGFHISPIALPSGFLDEEPRLPLAYDIAREGISVR